MQWRFDIYKYQWYFCLGPALNKHIARILNKYSAFLFSKRYLKGEISTILNSQIANQLAICLIIAAFELVLFLFVIFSKLCNTLMTFTTLYTERNEDHETYYTFISKGILASSTTAHANEEHGSKIILFLIRMLRNYILDKRDVDVSVSSRKF